jgi:hypothetical protein
VANIVVKLQDYHVRFSEYSRFELKVVFRGTRHWISERRSFGRTDYVQDEAVRIMNTLFTKYLTRTRENRHRIYFVAVLHGQT